MSSRETWDRGRSASASCPFREHRWASLDSFQANRAMLLAPCSVGFLAFLLA